MIPWKEIANHITSNRKKAPASCYVAYDEIDDVIIPQEVHLDTMFDNTFLENVTKFQKKSWDKIFVSFRFQPKNFRSEIVLTGRNYEENKHVIFSEETAFQAPPVLQVSSVWSNQVAMRMLAEQEMLSSMLDITTKILQHNQFCIGKQNTEFIKIDRCFYAPFLYMLEKPDLKSDFFTNFSKKKYMPFLKDNYPEAYEQVLCLQTAGRYWKYYHNADVEANRKNTTCNHATVTTE